MKRDGADLAIASRALPDSHIQTRQHPVRELMGRTFNVILRSAVMGGIKDTQCGFKLFKGDVGRTLPRQRSPSSNARRTMQRVCSTSRVGSCPTRRSRSAHERS